MGWAARGDGCTRGRSGAGARTVRRTPGWRRAFVGAAPFLDACLSFVVLTCRGGKAPRGGTESADAAARASD